MRGKFYLFLRCFPLICHLRDIFPQGKALKSPFFYDKYKFIEVKANTKAVPEREGGKPQVWRKGFKPYRLYFSEKRNEIAFW